MTSPRTLSGPRRAVLHIVDKPSVNDVPFVKSLWASAVESKSSVHLPSVHGAAYQLLILHDLSANACREAVRQPRSDIPPRPSWAQSIRW